MIREIFILLIILLMSCNKEVNNAPHYPTEKLIGKWDLRLESSHYLFWGYEQGFELKENNVFYPRHWNLANRTYETGNEYVGIWDLIQEKEQTNIVFIKDADSILFNLKILNDTTIEISGQLKVNSFLEAKLYKEL